MPSEDEDDDDEEREEKTKKRKFTCVGCVPWRVFLMDFIKKLNSLKLDEQK